MFREEDYSLFHIIIIRKIVNITLKSLDLT